MMKQNRFSSFLILALLATACAAQKAPPTAINQLDEAPADANARINPSNSDGADATGTLKSMTFTRSGGGSLKFVIEQKPEGKCISAKVIEKDFKSVDQSIEMESEALAEGLQAIFAGTLKVEALQTDSGALTGTWTELTLVDSKGQSKSIKTPVIKDEKHAELLRDLESAVREKLESPKPDAEDQLI